MQTSSRSYDSSSASSPVDLSGWQGAYVSVQATQMGTAVLAEGEITKSNPELMILDRGKGKNPLMIEAREIEHLKEIPRPIVVPKLIIRKLSAVDVDSVRQHLADRHGFALSEIDNDPAEAMQAHMLTHLERKLGHIHELLSEPALTSEAIQERARQLDDEHALMLECLSCGYYRPVGDPGRAFDQIAGKLDDDGQPAYHCQQCKDESEFKYV